MIIVIADSQSVRVEGLTANVEGITGMMSKEYKSEKSASVHANRLRRSLREFKGEDKDLRVRQWHQGLPCLSTDEKLQKARAEAHPPEKDGED